MRRGAYPDAGSRSPTALLSAYETDLAETIERVGRETVIERADVDPDLVDALLEGESPRVELMTAAAILAVDASMPDAGAIEAEARDLLLLGMTTAVLDVEALASGLDGALEPKELQQKLEGRQPMSLREYALVHQYLEAATT